MSLLDPARFNPAQLFYEAPAGKGAGTRQQGHPDASMGGGTKVGRLHHHRLAGLLTDGRLMTSRS